jgi:hypothetical protein
MFRAVPCIKFRRRGSASTGEVADDSEAVEFAKLIQEKEEPGSNHPLLAKSAMDND